MLAFFFLFVLGLGPCSLERSPGFLGVGSLAAGNCWLSLIDAWAAFCPCGTVKVRFRLWGGAEAADPDYENNGRGISA